MKWLLLLSACSTPVITVTTNGTTPSATQLSIARGTSVQVAVHVEVSGGSNNTVELVEEDNGQVLDPSVTRAAGISGVFDPAEVKAPGDSTLLLTTTANATNGAFPFCAHSPPAADVCTHLQIVIH